MEYVKNNLYTVQGWGPKAFFRLIKVDGDIAVIATVKFGKVSRVKKELLREYTSPKKSTVKYRRSSRF